MTLSSLLRFQQAVQADGDVDAALKALQADEMSDVLNIEARIEAAALRALQEEKDANA